MAGLLAVLSVGAGLCLGQPMWHALRQCLVALRLGERIGLCQQTRGALFQTLEGWGGEGNPGGTRGSQVLPARLVSTL